MTELERRSRARLLAATVAAAILVAVVGCGSDDEKRKRSDDGSKVKLTIGNSIPLEGGLSEFGPAAKKAGLLALDEIEAAIEAADAKHSVDLDAVDSGTDPTLAAKTARELVEADGAECIAGPWTAPEVIEVARSVAIPERVPLISPAATLDELTGLADDHLVNRTVPPDSAQGRVLASLIAEDVGDVEDATVVVGARDDAYGRNLANAFKLAWEERGGSLAKEFFYDPGSDSPAAIAERFDGAERDATVILDFAGSFARLAPALAGSAGYDAGATWAGDGLAATDLADQVPAGAIDGLRGIVPGTPGEDPAKTAFGELFADAEPRDVDRAGFDAQTFDAIVLCYLGAVAAGEDASGPELATALQSASAPPGKTVSWEQLPDAVEKLERGGEIDYQGASGPLDLDPAGDPTSGVYDIYEFDGGELVLVDDATLTRGEGG